MNIKKPWDLLEVPTVYWLIMTSVDHGRLAPSLELSHHQFLSAFKKVFFRARIIGTHFKESESTCQEKNIFGQIPRRYQGGKRTHSLDYFGSQKVIIDVRGTHAINFGKPF